MYVSIFSFSFSFSFFFFFSDFYFISHTFFQLSLFYFWSPIILLLTKLSDHENFLNDHIVRERQGKHRDWETGLNREKNQLEVSNYIQ